MAREAGLLTFLLVPKAFTAADTQWQIMQSTDAFSLQVNKPNFSFVMFRDKITACTVAFLYVSQRQAAEIRFSLLFYNIFVSH